MSRAPKPIDPTASPRHRFGYALRQARTQEGFSLHGLAHRLGKSVSYLSAVELAEVRCTRTFAADCERILGAQGRLLALWQQADRDWDELRSPAPPPAVEVVKALLEAEERMRAIARELAGLRRHVGALPIIETALTTSEPTLTIAPAGAQVQRLPLAALVAEQRRRLSLSLAELARHMERAAQAEGSWCGATRQDVSQVERKGRIPHPERLRWLAHALELPVAQVAQAAAPQRRLRRRGGGELVALGRLDLAG
jgi:transcriptional regulator with XRE-family HTH domain